MPDFCRNNYTEKHYVDEVGTAIYINCGQDVSGAVDCFVYMKRPDGSVVKRAATPVVFEGSLNYVRMVLESGDFNQAGDYSCQVWLTLGTWNGGGNEFIITVDERMSSSSSSSSSSSGA
jgi:hypothetical protein